MLIPTSFAAGELALRRQLIQAMTSRNLPVTALLVALMATASGCITCGQKSVSVGQMQPCWQAEERACKRPIDLTMLQRDPAAEHVVLARDVLGIYVEGILSGAEISSGGAELPAVNFPNVEGGSSPSVGQPFTVQSDGALHLPLIAPINVAGMSIQQVADTVRKSFVDAGTLKEDPTKSYVQVTMIRRRTNRILVMREDAVVSNPALIRGDTYVLANRGSGSVVELPEANSDLLNALIETGGLPGEDARNEVWILRGGTDWETAKQGFGNGMTAEEVAGGPQRRHTVIPLRQVAGKPLPFGKEDVVLNDGDVIFVEKRHEEYFYTGGLLGGGKIPLPRDEDVDVMEAIALSSIGAAGPAGINASASQFRSGPGNVVPPTRVVVLRKLPNGQQIKIDVDLRKAMVNPEERIVIKPEDFVMLHYRGHELVSNIALNFVNVNYSWVNAVD